MPYRPTIGLEIHIEVKTKSKMFCSCLNNPDERRPNKNICPICVGYPGTLPVINEEAVKNVIKTGLSLNCQIPKYSKFDRKNYFYPDLPKGYQISQYYSPLCLGGYLEIPSYEENVKPKKSQVPNPTTAHFQWAGSPSPKFGAVAKSQINPKFQIPKFKKIRIREIHLEEDTGRLVHPERADYSLVDFNRAGTPLMELVTEPDINSESEAKKFCQELQLILRYLMVSDADMEKGQMRCEVNISVSKNSKLGTKVEIKNLNSFKAVERAINYEISRQSRILKRKGRVIQETRGWNPDKEITVSQRTKEEAQDYRYFPEPDLPPLCFSEQDLLKIRAEIPELPEEKRRRFKREYELLPQDIELFVQNKDLGEYFEKVISELNPRLKKEELSKFIKLAANYLITDLQGLLKDGSAADKNFLITANDFADFIILIGEGKISSKTAKIVLEEMFKTGADPKHIVEERGLVQITDGAEIEKLAKAVISENQKAAEDFKKGKSEALQFLVGKVMARSRGKANPQIAKSLLEKFLRCYQRGK